MSLANLDYLGSCSGKVGYSVFCLFPSVFKVSTTCWNEHLWKHCPSNVNIPPWTWQEKGSGKQLSYESLRIVRAVIKREVASQQFTVVPHLKCSASTLYRFCWYRISFKTWNMFLLFNLNLKPAKASSGVSLRDLPLLKIVGHTTRQRSSVSESIVHLYRKILDLGLAWYFLRFFF